MNKIGWVRKRLKPTIRREKILISAVDLAITNGYNRLQREDVAKAAGVSVSLITTYFGNMEKLGKEVLKRAINLKIHVIVLQGLCVKDPIALEAPEELIEEARVLI